MDPEQIYEYSLLMADITERLRRHAYVDDREVRHVFQYLILPSFSAPVAWDVFRRRRKGYPDECVLIRSSWQRDVDYERMRTPVERMKHGNPFVPSIQVHEVRASSLDLVRLADELKAITVPIGMRPDIGGIDGVFFEVAIEQPPHYIGLAPKCRLSWWSEVPAAWKELGEWARRATTLFQAVWTDKGNGATVPLRIRAIDDVAARQEAQRLFHENKYAHAAELLAEVSQREKLTAAESKMLELALKRMGGPGHGGPPGG